MTFQNIVAVYKNGLKTVQNYKWLFDDVKKEWHEVATTTRIRTLRATHDESEIPKDFQSLLGRLKTNENLT